MWTSGIVETEIKLIALPGCLLRRQYFERTNETACGTLFFWAIHEDQGGENTKAEAQYIDRTHFEPVEVQL